MALVGAVGCGDSGFSIETADDSTGPDEPEPLEDIADLLEPTAQRGVAIVGYVDDLTVKLQAELAHDKVLSPSSPTFGALAKLHQSFGVTEIAPLFDPVDASPEALALLRDTYAAKRPRVLPTGPLPRLDRFFVVRFDPTIDVADVVQALATEPAVLSVEPNTFVTTSTNDPYGDYHASWGLFQIDAPSTWLTTTGTGTVVAVIDTGIAATHCDLTGQILPGYDFANGDASPDDTSGHGTHVAGIIAAIANNGFGIAGTAPHASILPVQALGGPNGGTVATLASAVLWATYHDADVINLSLGGPGQSSVIDTTIQIAEALGVVTVTAAGNDTKEAALYFPTNSEHALTIAASDAADLIASFSNYGVKIDVAAPGVEILSTVHGAYSGFGTISDYGCKYAPNSGTSMAAPYVSGLAALLIAQHPSWTVEQIKQAIRRSSTDIMTPGFDAASGYGRIDALDATTLPSAQPSASLVAPRNLANVENQIALSGFALPSPGRAAGYKVSAGYGSTPATWTAALVIGAANVTDGPLGTIDTRDLRDGATTLRLVTTDTTGGLIAQDRNMVMVNNVYLTAPATGQSLTTPSVSVLGKVVGKAVTSLGFDHYTVSWAPMTNPMGAFTTFAQSASPTIGSGPTMLATWNLAGIPEGPVRLKLEAYFNGFSIVETVDVIIDRHLLAGWPAATTLVPTFKSPKIVDLDRNGVGELVYGASVYNASGAVRPGWTSSPGLGRTNPAIVNIDASPDLEVIAIEMGSYYQDLGLPNGGAPVVRAYKHDKTLVWQYAVTHVGLPANGVPSSVSIGDVTGDSGLEVVFSVYFNHFNANSETMVFVLDARTGAIRLRFAVAGRSWSSIAIGDLNGGKADLVLNATLPNGDGVVYAMSAGGTALAGWPRTVPSAEFRSIDPVLGDADWDCRLDVLVGRHLFKRDGTLFAGWPTTNPAWSTGAFANVDGDVQQELITGGSGHSLVHAMNSDASTMFGALDNRGENLVLASSGENFHRGNPVLADLDGNGRAEILRPSENGHTSPYVAMALYDIDTLTGAHQPNHQRFVFNSTATDFRSYPIYSTAAVGDLDGNGQLDLALAAGGRIYVWALGVPYVASNHPWPMFQRDLLNSGAAPRRTPCLAFPG